MKEQIRDFLEYLRLNRNASDHTVSAYASDIAQYLGFVAAEAGTAAAGLEPAALAVSPRREQKIPSHLSVDEMSRLLEMPDASDPLGCRDRAILELFYASGLRLSELVGLDVADVNVSGRMVRVFGKGAKERLVPFNAATVESLRAWLTVRYEMRRKLSEPAPP